jgi:hypothetical protein
VRATRVAVVTAVAFAAVVLLRRSIILDHDTFRDLLLARECFDGVACVTHGPRAGLGDYMQGAVWIWFLVAMRALGVVPAATDLAVGAFLALAIGLLVALGTRLRLSLGWSVAVGLAVLAVYTELMPLGVLHNPSLLPLPLIACYGATVLFALRGSAAWAGAGGLALALSLDTHGIAVTLVPGWALLLASARRRAFDPLLAGAFTLPACMWLVSRDAFESNLETAARTGLLWLGVAGLVVVVGAAWALVRPRLSARSAEARAVIAVAALTASTLVGTLGLTRYYGEELLPYYLMPAVPGVALLAALAVATALRAAPAGVQQGVAWAAALAAALGVWSLRPPPRGAGDEPWSLTDLQAISSLLDASGYAYQDTFVRVFAPHRREVVAAMAAFEPNPRGGPPDPSLDDLVLVPAPAGVGAPADARVSVVPLPDGGALWSTRVTPWIARTRGQVCYGPLGDDAEARCFDVEVGPPGVALTVPVMFQPRSLPYLADIEMAAVRGELSERHAEGTRATWTFAVTADGPGERLLFVDTRPTDQPGCEWQITAVRGFAAEAVPDEASGATTAALPARAVVVRSEGAADGSVSVTRRTGVAPCRPDLPQFTPDIFELPVDSGLLALPFFGGVGGSAAP